MTGHRVVEQSGMTKRRITCECVGIYERALTRGKDYDLLDQDAPKQRVRIHGDNDRTRWYPMSCFDINRAAAPTLVHWRFDDPVTDPTNDFVEVSMDLSDGTRRWCIFVTPAYLRSWLERSSQCPGIHSHHMIIVSKLTVSAVDCTLACIDQQGELIGASLPLETESEARSDDH
jgi:hypothetical protein